MTDAGTLKDAADISAGDNVIINGKTIKYTSDHQNQKLALERLGDDLINPDTGVFTNQRCV